MTIPKRFVLVFGTFLLSVLLLFDRIAISASAPAISESLSLSPTQMGWVLSIFALGYALFQTPTGILADRIGPRKILTAVVTFWSIFTALTGAAFSFVSILIYRFLFGVGEAGAFPGIARATFSWIPMKERGIVNGINFSGARLGPAMALPVVAWMIELMGWRQMFGVLGLIGIAWAVFWYLWFRNDPTQHASITSAERDYILETRQQPDPNQSAVLSLKTLMVSRNMWLTMVQYFCSNFTFFFTLTWLFPHIKETYGLEMMEAAVFSAAPLVAGAIGHLFSGWLVDKIYSSGRWRLSRLLPAALGFSLAAVGLVASVLFTNDVVGAIVFLSIAIFGADMTLSPSWSFCVDIGRRHSGAVSGTMNMAGNLGSFVTALAFPYMLTWTGTTTPFFLAAAVFNVLAIFIWLAMKPDRPLEEY